MAGAAGQAFALLTWAGPAALGSQARGLGRPTNPFSGAFFWKNFPLLERHVADGPVPVSPMAAGRRSSPSLRLSGACQWSRQPCLVAVLLAVQAITASRDLLGCP